MKKRIFLLVFVALFGQLTFAKKVITTFYASGEIITSGYEGDVKVVVFTDPFIQDEQNQRHNLYHDGDGITENYHNFCRAVASTYGLEYMHAFSVEKSYFGLSSRAIIGVDKEEGLVLGIHKPGNPASRTTKVSKITCVGR